MFKILDEACTPTRGTKYSAAIDLRSREDITIGAGETVLIPLGVKIDLDLFVDTNYKSLAYVDNEEFEHWKQSHYLQLMLRSGLGKKGLILPNGVGVIDLDYQDEIMMIVHNPICGVYQDFDDSFELEKIELKETHTYNAANNEVRYTIKKGDRVGQITLLEHKSYLFGVDSDEVRSGGFGSTGSK